MMDCALVKRNSLQKRAVNMGNITDITFQQISEYSQNQSDKQSMRDPDCVNQSMSGLGIIVLINQQT